MIPFFKKQEKRNIKMPAHLTRAEQKEIREIIKRAEKDDGIPRTAQQSIPFDRMFQDGICRIGSDYYTKTLRSRTSTISLHCRRIRQRFLRNGVHFLTSLTAPFILNSAS